MQSPHSMTIEEWIEHNKVGKAVEFHNLCDNESNKVETVVVREDKVKSDNPVSTIIESNSKAESMVLIVVPDVKGASEEAFIDIDIRTQYSGRVLFDQCLKAGIKEDNIIIDHLNDFPQSYWMARITK